MYISAEGRTLPCMALSGMDIQQQFPLIGEIGLAACEYALQCLGGCRAAALETMPEDILSPDRATCAIFKGGWAEKIYRQMAQLGL